MTPKLYFLLSILSIVAAHAQLLAQQPEATSETSRFATPDGITIPNSLSVPQGVARLMALPGREMSMSLSAPGRVAILKFSGAVASAGDGKMGSGTEKFKPTQIQLNNSASPWVKIVSFSVTKDWFLLVKVESGQSYLIKVTGSAEPASFEERLPLMAAAASDELAPGVYSGAADGLPSFSVTLVSQGAGIKVSEIGYKFTGYASVGRESLKNKQPYGTSTDGKLAFEFMVLTSIGIPNLNVPRANLGTGVYKAELKVGDNGQLKCTLSQIDQLDGVYADVGFNLETITFDMGSEKPPLQKEYSITLKKKEN